MTKQDNDVMAVDHDKDPRLFIADHTDNAYDHSEQEQDNNECGPFNIW